MAVRKLLPILVWAPRYERGDLRSDLAAGLTVHVVRIDAALSFVNAVNVKKLLLDAADTLTDAPRALVLDASGINDLDATGAATLDELLDEMDDRDVAFHIADVKGPVRDVMRNARLWARLGERIHTSTSDAVAAITADRPGPDDQRSSGIDEREKAERPPTESRVE